MNRTTLAEMTVGDILNRWPETARAFNRRRMACPGCVMAPFMTLAETCRAYDVDRHRLVSALLRIIGGPVNSNGNDRP